VPQPLRRRSGSVFLLLVRVRGRLVGWCLAAIAREEDSCFVRRGGSLGLAVVANDNAKLPLRIEADLHSRAVPAIFANGASAASFASRNRRLTVVARLLACFAADASAARSSSLPAINVSRTIRSCLAVMSELSPGSMDIEWSCYPLG
jgi:hypothetical protein